MHPHIEHAKKNPHFEHDTAHHYEPKHLTLHHIEHLGQADLFAKAQGHKYVKRERTASGKYRYWYRLPNGGLVTSQSLHKGAKFKHHDGHYEITHHDAETGQVHFKHDTTGKTHTMHHDDFREHVHSYHKETLKEKKADTLDRYKAAKKHGSKKQVDRQRKLYLKMKDGYGSREKKKGPKTADDRLGYKVHKHTKTGEVMHVVTMKDRLTRADFMGLKQQVKTAGGYYSKYAGGFVFKTEDTAKGFIGGSAKTTPPKSVKNTAPEPEPTDAPDDADTKIEKAVKEAKPENRADSERKVLGLPPPPHELTFEQYKKQQMAYRHQYVIDQLQKRIDRAKKMLDGPDEAVGTPYSAHNYAGRALKENQKLLDDYLIGRIDHDLKEKPMWGFLQKQYDSLGDKSTKDAKSLKRKLSSHENKARKEHQRLVEKAYKDGLTIPATVLNDYPDILKEDPKPEPLPDVGYEPSDSPITIYLGGEVSEQKKRTLPVKDYTKVNPKDIYLQNEDTILDHPRPSYIPKMDVDQFAGYDGKHQQFDVARVGANQYLITNRYPVSRSGARGSGSRVEKEDVEGKEYFLMSADTLAATWDYYRKLYRAEALKKHEEREDRAEGRYNQAKDEALKAGKQWAYPPFKRKKPRIPKPRPSGRSMLVTQGNFIQDVEGFKAASLREGDGNAQVFANYQKMLRELDYKINDMRLQQDYNSESNTYQKGRETAYGDTNLRDDLLKSHGVKIKRQNGQELHDNEVTRIGTMLDSVFDVFGNRKSMAQKYGLKVSYAGNKRMHASKAIGLFVPSMNAIAVSEVGRKEPGMTLAHEFSHFMDAYLGDKEGHYHLSDKDGTLASDIAKTFRDSMGANKLNTSDTRYQYLSRTCECFARAFEQYYAVKTGTQDTLYEEDKKEGSYVDHNIFTANIQPMIDRFFKENNALLKAMMKTIRLTHTKRVPDNDQWKRPAYRR